MADKTFDYRNVEAVQEKLVEMTDGTYSKQVIAHPPYALLTDNDGEGPNARLRVDVGQTGFFAGREARTFHEFSVSNGSTLVVKAVAATNVILMDLTVSLNSGEVKVYTVTGGSEGGSFSTTLPIIPTNSMSSVPQPAYTPQMVITAGGTHTGGTILDELWVDAGLNPAKESTAGDSADSARGVPAGTYYFRINALADAAGIFRARWEERPSGV